MHLLGRLGSTINIFFFVYGDNGLEVRDQGSTYGRPTFTLNTGFIFLHNRGFNLDDLRLHYNSIYFFYNGLVFNKAFIVVYLCLFDLNFGLFCRVDTKGGAYTPYATTTHRQTTKISCLPIRYGSFGTIFVFFNGTSNTIRVVGGHSPNGRTYGSFFVLHVTLRGLTYGNGGTRVVVGPTLFGHTTLSI